MLRFLLLQMRNADDPMREQEVACFGRALGCEREQIGVHDFLVASPTKTQLDRADMVLLGGSGHYSVAGGGPWLDRAMDGLREIHGRRKPTFASCWGFQAMARAIGGRVINDLANAEIGTIDLHLTPAGEQDPIFGPLGVNFSGQAGHEDHVVELPEGAVLLASSERVRCQAYCFPDRPIYCTQFHPELNVADLLARVETYPEYVERIAGIPHERFGELCRETPQTEALLPRFVREVFD